MRLAAWVVPVLISWHVAAVFLGALPPAERFTAERAKVSADAVPEVRSDVARAFDASLRAALPALNALATVGDWARPITRVYHSFTGTRQNWSMFGDPPRADRYMRLRYYVQPQAGGRSWTATELVWPAHREDRVRLLQSFRDSFRDKALDNSLDAFRDHRDAVLLRADTRSEALPDDLAPIARYFARRFSRLRGLDAQGERITRIEVWPGYARSHQPGQEPDGEQQAERLALLQSYYEGPLEQRFNVAVPPPYHAAEQEADIQWVLEYFEEP